MIKSNVEVDLIGLKSQSVYNFMLICTDERYQSWWPGVHLAFHTIKHYPGNIGNLVYFDEYIGQQRIKFTAKIKELIPGSKLVYQLRFLVNLPAWMVLEFQDLPDGMKITHIFMLGYSGFGRVFDPLFRLFFSKNFQRDLEEHAETEFKLLAKILS
jgi:hypothetical protein